MSLTAEQRRCLELAYVDGFSQDQIATEISSPLGTARCTVSPVASRSALMSCSAMRRRSRRSQAFEARFMRRGPSPS